MNTTIANIRSAYKDARQFADKSSNSGIVEFTHAVRAIKRDFYWEIQQIAANDMNDVYKFIQAKMKNLGWNNYQFEKFESIANAAIKGQDIQPCVRGLFLYAKKNATLCDQLQFIEWFEDEQANGRGIMDINTMATKPEDHFQCADDKTWEELAEYYNERS